MITGSQKRKWKIMNAEKKEKKRKRNLILQFQTTKLNLKFC